MLDPRLKQHLVNLEDRIVRMEKEDNPDYDMIDAFYAKIDGIIKLMDEEAEVDRIELEEDRSKFDEV